MGDNKNSRSKLANRQIEVARRNLISICRFAVKSLIDTACFSNIDEGCEEFINFCAVLEQVLQHRITPHKTWYGSGDSTSFWDYIRAVCRYVPHSCISSIDAIENIRSPTAKGRAFIRCGLMEKKLSEYISAGLQQPHITRKHYYDGAIMLSDDAVMLCGILMGLNAIDFSFCLKGTNMNLLGPLAIDFTPFLRFQQSQASRSCDQEEMRELSNSSISSSIMHEDTDMDSSSWQNKYKNLQHQYKSVCEQKSYLEELVRMRERQVEEISTENQNLDMRQHFVEAEAQRDQLQLEQVVLELQEQLAKEKSERQALQQRLSLSMKPQKRSQPFRDIQMAEIAVEGSRELELQGSTNSADLISLPLLRKAQQQDNRSLLSGSSGQFTAKEDSHSMIPLTGSLTDVQVRPAAETPVHQPAKTQDEDSQASGGDVASPSRQPSQRTSESTDMGSFSEGAEPEYRGRPPSQAFPSFSYVDLDTSLEHDDNGDSAFVAGNAGDPLGIGNSKSTGALPSTDLEHKEMSQTDGTKLISLDIEKKEEVREMKDEGKDCDDDSDSNVKADAKSDIGDSKSDIGNSKSDIGNSKSDLGNSNSDIGNSKSDLGNSKSDIGNSDYDIVNESSAKPSSESSLELSGHSGSETSATPLAGSTEEEYLKIGGSGEEGQSDSAVDTTDDSPEGKDKKDDKDQKEVGAVEPTLGASRTDAPQDPASAPGAGDKEEGEDGGKKEADPDIDDSATGEAALDADDSTTGEAALNADDSTTGEAALDADNSTTGEAALDADNSTTGEAALDADDSTTGEAALDADDSTTGEAALDADDSAKEEVGQGRASPVDSGSSETDREWDLLSDSSVNGHSTKGEAVEKHKEEP